MSSKPAIQVSGLGKHYQSYDKPHHRLLQAAFGGRLQYSREFSALQHVSFSINRGETVGIIGRNGSGKSTLLQLICGTLTPSAGQIEVNGRIAALLELGAGFNPEFSGRENVFLNASILGLSKTEIESRLEQILAFADIGDFIDQPVKTYSSGMFVRLAFAVIAHVDADILIIDEALAVGDAFFTQKCMRFLRQFKEHGTILFVSHDTAAVVNLCERAIWLDHGQLKAIGEAKTVSELYLKGLYATQQQVQPDSEPAIATTQHLASALEPEATSAAQQPDTSFGTQRAMIRRVQLIGDNGSPMVAFQGGEKVKLLIEAIARQDISQPLLGFHLKDRLGQILFGDNTFVACQDSQIHVESGQLFRAEFSLTMPYLGVGDYVISAAVGEGTQQEHVIHHWQQDALAIRSQTTVLHGLFAIPTTPTLVIGE